MPTLPSCLSRGGAAGVQRRGARWRGFQPRRVLELIGFLRRIIRGESHPRDSDPRRQAHLARRDFDPDGMIYRCRAIAMAGLAGRGFLWAIEIAGYLLPLLALAYLSIVAWAWLQGHHPIPAAAVFTMGPAAGMAAAALAWLPHVLLIVGICGGLLQALTRAGLAPVAASAKVDLRLSRIWGAAAVPVAFALFLFWAASGGWAGRFQPHEVSYLSIGGLLPYSDASSYFASAFNLLDAGAWDGIAAQRPVASALRDILIVAGGFSYLGFMQVQLLLLSACSALATWSVLRWKGPWAAIAFFGLSFGLTRTFANTAMTEPLGAIWALVSLAFFIQAMRRKAAMPALIGFTALLLALSSRMGSMFAIPAILLWMVFGLGGSRRQRGVLLLQGAGLIVAVIAFTAMMSRIASPEGAQVGGNFSYTICGLARGTDWYECSATFHPEIERIRSEGGSISEVNSFIAGQAIAAFVQDPHNLFLNMIENSWLYMRTFPAVLVELYSNDPLLRLDRVSRILLAFAIAAGVVMSAIRGGALLELMFWGSLAAGSIASAAIVYRDDGLRTLHVTHIFLSCLVAVALSGWSSRPSPAPAEPVCRLDRMGIAGIAAVAALMIVNSVALKAQVLGSGLPPITRNDAAFQGSGDGTIQVRLGGCVGWSGFVVGRASDVSPSSVRVIDPSVFSDIVTRTLLREEFEMLTRRGEAPWAFASIPYTQGMAGTSLMFVGPPELLTDCPAPDRIAYGRQVGRVVYVDTIRSAGDAGGGASGSP